MKYAWIDTQCSCYTLTDLCEVLTVSASGIALAAAGRRIRHAWAM